MKPATERVDSIKARAVKRAAGLRLARAGRQALLEKRRAAEDAIPNEARPHRDETVETAGSPDHWRDQLPDSLTGGSS